jgi:large subunit ribosomal protein L15
MRLNSLRPAEGSVKNRKRIARGTGSGHGGTSTRGQKGAKSRAGFKSKRAHEGGQMPLQMRLPKSGFKNTHRRYKTFRPESFVVFNLSELSKIAEKHNLSSITISVLYNLGYISKNDHVKVLGNGNLNHPLEISANRFSDSAKKSIIESGSKFFFVLKSNQIQGIAEVGSYENVTPSEISKYFSFIGESDPIHVVSEGNITSKFNIQAHKVDSDVVSMLENQGSFVTII